MVHKLLHQIDKKIMRSLIEIGNPLLRTEKLGSKLYHACRIVDCCSSNSRKISSIAESTRINNYITFSLGISGSSSSRTQVTAAAPSSWRRPSLGAETGPICGVLAGVGARS